MARCLIVAYQTAGGRALRGAVERVTREDAATEFVLLVPATLTQHLFTWTQGEARAVARARAEEAAEHLRATGVRLTEVRIGDPDPFVAVSGELAGESAYQSIIVSTFPPGISRWLRLDLPSRLEKQFDIPVTHVIVDPQEAR